MAKLGFYKWYPSDAQTDIEYSAMSYEERGFYLSCLDMAWINEGLPADKTELARAMHLRLDTFNRLWKRVGKKFEQVGTKLVNARQERERCSATRKSQLAVESVNHRYERSTNVPIRASDSDSLLVVSSSSKKQTPELVITPGEIAKTEDLEIAAMWIRAGFDSPEGFEGWYRMLYAEHPTRGEYGIARDFLAMEVIAGTLTRTEFEEGYAAHRLSGAWKRDGGRYIPKLSVFCRDRGWKFPPTMAKVTIGNVEDNY